MRAKFVVAYDGTDFHGFADNVGRAHGDGGVDGTAIVTVVRTPVELTGAGRTDAGVHAWGQVVSGDLPDGTDLDGVVSGGSTRCVRPTSPCVRRSGPIDDFDARFSARWRHYRYDVWNAAAPNPLLVGHAWHVVRPLDLDTMTAASATRRR